MYTDRAGHIFNSDRNNLLVLIKKMPRFLKKRDIWLVHLIIDVVSKYHLPTVRFHRRIHHRPGVALMGLFCVLQLATRYLYSRVTQKISTHSQMPNNKLRQQIIHEAARLMYGRQESEYYRAKMKAARKICRGWVKPSHLPSNREIRAEIQRFAFLYEGDDRVKRLREMRFEALRLMRLLRDFRPRLIGSTLTGHVRQGSDIDLHLFPGSLEAVLGRLDWEGMDYDVEHKRIRKQGEERVFTHVHIRERFPIELTIYPADKAHYVFRSSITGKSIERASIGQFEKLLSEEYPNDSLDEETILAHSEIDRFQIYRVLMLPLQHVKQDRKLHPEGDALYHSLQVFDLACDELPYDEEFLLAALLHDVGKGVDRHHHVESGIEALGDSITKRTRWLIQHHMDAHALRDGSLGARARRRLAKSDDYETLQILEECDDAGRVPGVEVPELEEALDYIRDLARQYG